MGPEGVVVARRRGPETPDGPEISVLGSGPPRLQNHR